jgi:hypothetical protein
MPTGKGWVRTKEYREKLSIADKKAGHGKWMTGKKHSEETKQKMRLIRKGKPNLSVTGDKHPCWKGGITLGKNAKEYARIACLKRKARKLGADGSYTLGEWQLLKKQLGIYLVGMKEFK